MAKKSVEKKTAEPVKVAAEKAAPTVEEAKVAPLKAVHETDMIKPVTTSESCHETVHVKACRDMLFGDMPVI